MKDRRMEQKELHTAKEDRDMSSEGYRESSPGNADMGEQEIDLVEIIRKLWTNKKLIIRVTVVSMVLGVLVALLSAKEYTAGCTMVPQTSDKNGGGSVTRLLSQFGMGSIESVGAVLSPKVYSKILGSVPFRKEVMYTPLRFEKWDEPITLVEYYTDSLYRKFSLGQAILKYTVGLPGVLLDAIRGKQEEPDYPEEVAGPYLERYSLEEYACSKMIENIVTLDLNDKDGYLSLTVAMPEPYVAAQLAEKIQMLLQKYITEFKVEKVQSNLDFVQERYDEAKREFEQIQGERAAFRDANKNITSARALTEQEKLDTRYNLALGVYSELAKQLEQAKIQVKETTPILTVVDPVSIPIERSKPKRGLICIMFTFLGLCVGAGLVLGLPALSQMTGNEKLRKWVKD